MQISSEDFTVDAVCTMLPFVLKVPKTSGPPRRARGLPSFVCMIKIMPTSMLLFVMPLGTGLDKSTRGLAALHYEMLPAAGKVVCGA